MIRSVTRDGGCDDGSLPLALLFVLVGSAVVALLAPIAITQIQSSRADIRRQHTLDAAQAGLDVALGAIQATSDQWGNGALTALPACGSTLTGMVDQTDRYDVTIDYFTLDPGGQSDKWVRDNRMCSQGTPPSTPTFALFRSVGTDQTTGWGRRLEATYTFYTTNANVAGGEITIGDDATGKLDLCLTAPSANPAAGSALTIDRCTAGDPRQTFAYNGSVQLVLVSSQSPPGQGGMCVHADTTQKDNEAVVFQPCVTPAPPAQQWFYNAEDNFEGTDDGQTFDGYCLNVVPGSAIVLHGKPDNCEPPHHNNNNTFVPQSSVGAGRAGPGLHELINYEEFGRCIDIPQKTDPDYIQAYPCKQAPDASGVQWDEVWSWTVDQPGPIYATTDAVSKHNLYAAGSWCMVSPKSTANGAYVDVKACTPGGSTPDDEQWTVYGDTHDYATSYVIKDAWSHCLTPTDPNASPPDFTTSTGDISKIKVAPCDGSDLQKWNAPPHIVVGPPLKDIHE